MPEKELEYKKTNIFYRISGAGRPVILLHGLPFDGSLWNKQCEAVPGFKFIVPDLPGSGHSDRIHDMSITGMAEVIKAIGEAEQISTAAIIGHSIGGYVALAFAEKYPEHLSGLGLFHSTAYPDTEERRTIRKKGIEFIRKNGAYEFLKTMIPNLFSPNSKQTAPGLVAGLVDSAKNFSSATLVSYYEAMLERPDRSSVLKDANSEILLVAGKYDSAVPLNDSLKQSYLSAVSHFHILFKSAHLGMIEETKKSNQILMDYLTNLTARE